MMAQSSQPIRYWNRSRQQVETESIYGEWFMRWLYETQAGVVCADRWFSKKWFSMVYGAYNDSCFSKFKIAPFIRQFDIAMNEFEPGPFRTFNEFFIRRFRPGVRTFVSGPHTLAAFAEGRYLAYAEVGKQNVIPVKQARLQPGELLGDRKLAQPFEGGPVLIARLCPTDYHRFHFPCDGSVATSLRVSGELHSVNPLALRYKPDVFIKNERQVTILETQTFGLLAIVEVGAMCVGKMVQTYSVDQPFRRGDEKGYFLFGGSTVILLGEPNRWLPSDDLLTQTRQERETFVRLGESVGRSIETNEPH